MKKISRRLFLACVLSGALLAGCGETKTTPVAPGTAQPATTYPNPNPNYPNPNPNPYPEAGTPVAPNNSAPAETANPPQPTPEAAPQEVTPTPQ